MKRYVLLDNDLIYDRTKLDKDKDWLIIRILERIDKGETDNLARQIKLQSDNLIDLLEVGDCVELCNKNDEVFIYHIADKEVYNNAMVDINDLAEEGNDYVKAIWKRNGNVMRRYEV